MARPFSFYKHLLRVRALQPLQLGASRDLRSYHLQNGGVAADDEGQAAEALDAMGDSHGQLLVQVLGAALRSDTNMQDDESDQRAGRWEKANPPPAVSSHCGRSIYQDVVAIRRLPRIQQGR